MATGEDEFLSGLQPGGIRVLNLQGLDANLVAEQWEPGAGTRRRRASSISSWDA